MFAWLWLDNHCWREGFRNSSVDIWKTYRQADKLVLADIQTQSHLQRTEQSSQSAPHPSCSQVSSPCEAECTPTPHLGSSPAGGSVRQGHSQSERCHMCENSSYFKLHLCRESITYSNVHQKLGVQSSLFSWLPQQVKGVTIFLPQSHQKKDTRELHVQTSINRFSRTYQWSTITRSKAFAREQLTGGCPWTYSLLLSQLFATNISIDKSAFVWQFTVTSIVIIYRKQWHIPCTIF